MSWRLAGIVGVAVAVALTAGACGRRATPERPASAESMPRAPVDVTDPEGQDAPDRTFILDPLLQ
ncbi:MAG: hypothetical protein AAGD34_18990 [Pseudomonadota bacterium]